MALSESLLSPPPASLLRVPYLSPLSEGRQRRYGCIAARRGQGGFGCGGRVQRQVLVRGNSWGEVGRWGEGGVAWL